MPLRAPAILAVLALFGALVAATPIARAQDAAATAEAAVATTQEVLVALRDIGLQLDGLQVRSSVAVEEGGSALLELPHGTLVDARLVQVAEGWSVRGFYLVAGDASEFGGWTAPWRRRLAAADAFLSSSAVTADEQNRRRPEELAPLVWFEDPDESSRLWGLNPVTFRMMQALRMVPMGPMQTGRGPGNPVPRRAQQ